MRNKKKNYKLDKPAAKPIYTLRRRKRSRLLRRQCNWIRFVCFVKCNIRKKRQSYIMLPLRGRHTLSSRNTGEQKLLFSKRNNDVHVKYKKKKSINPPVHGHWALSVSYEGHIRNDVGNILKFQNIFHGLVQNWYYDAAPDNGVFRKQYLST